MIKVYFDGVLIDTDSYVQLDNDYKLFTDSFKLGSVASDTFSLGVIKNAVSTQPINVRIEDDTTIFNFVVDKMVEDDNVYTYSLTDKLLNFNFEYDASVLINNKATNEEECYLSDIWKDICNQANVEYDETYVFENDIVVNWYDNRVQARRYLSFIAELQSGYACILENGKQSFKKQKRSSVKTIDADECSDLIIGEKKTITRVVYDGGAFKWEFGDDTGDTLYLQSDNVFIVNEDIVENIYNNIKDFEFYIIDVPQAPMDSTVKAGDVITFNDNGKLCPTIAQYSMSYYGGWSGKYYLKVDTKKQQETQITRTSQQVRNIQTKVDRLNNEFSVIAEEIEKLTDYIRNVGTTGNYLMLPDTPKSGGAINTLSIKGFELMQLYPSMTYPSEYTYSGVLNFYTLIFDTVNTFNNNPHYIYVNSPIPLQKLGSVHDELLIEQNKVKVTQRIGYDFINEQWSVLSTPITHELNDVLLPTFEDNTYIKVLYFDDLIYNAEYIVKNDLTSTFTTQLESSSQFKLNRDEISSKVSSGEFNSTVTQLANGISSKVSKGEIVSEINQSEEQVKIEAQKIKLEGYTTINDGFSVDLEGNATMNNATINGSTLKLADNTEIVGGNGILTNLQYISMTKQLGFINDYSSGVSLRKGVIDIEAYIPANFTIKSAFLTLRAYNTRNLYKLPETFDYSTDEYGKITNIRVYKAATNYEYIYSDQGFWGINPDNPPILTEITNALATGGYTNPTTAEVSITSIDISSYLSVGQNTLWIQTADIIPSPYNDANVTIASQKTQTAVVILTIIGFTK